MEIKTALNRLIHSKSLTKSEAASVMQQIMAGQATDAQIAGFLVALRLKGETVPEISGAASVMIDKSEPFAIETENVVDTCGTGGDNLHTFNISTTAAFIAAGAGVKIAKHGNRSVSSKCGSADILQNLGVNIEIDSKKFVEVFNKIGLAFLFAPSYHKAMKFAIGPRKELGLRTIFNILGPLTNPARIKRQVLGVFDKNLCHTMASVLADLGSEHVMVVHGHNGLDELTTTGETHVSELKNGTIENYTIHPSDFGIEQAKIELLQSPNCASNLSITMDILAGKGGAPTDIAVYNAAAAITVSGLAKDMAQGVKLAYQAVNNGAALNKLEQLKQETNG